MQIFKHHPRLDELQSLSAHDLDERRHTAVGVHLERCAECQASLRFLRAVGEAGDAAIYGETLPADLLDRVLGARAAGERVMLPTGGTSTATARSPASRWKLRVAAAMVLLAAVGVALATHQSGVEAGTTAGTLHLSPSSPQRGEVITVRYDPAASLVGARWLALRARVRTASGGSYNRGIPTLTMAPLRLGSDGAYFATFRLPDSAVFAAFAVEDSAGAHIDDDGGKLWELLLAGADGRPLFAALEQRANDLMGRNMEEGLVTARRMVALYPNDIRSWMLLRSHLTWIGRGQDDTVLAVHRARLAAFDGALRREPHPDGEAMGRVAWFGWSLDSTVAHYWKARVVEEAPSNSFSVQWRLMSLSDTLRLRSDTASVLARLDTLWQSAPDDRRAQVATYAMDVALPGRDTTLALRWADRVIAASRIPAEAARDVAGWMSGFARLRPAATERLRRSLLTFDAPGPAERALTETVADRRRRLDRERRQTLAALGRTLVAEGKTRAGLDTLSLAVAEGWDLATFRIVRQASLTGGDRATARRMLARIAADPRTDSALVDSAQATLTTTELDAAREEFAHRMVEGEPVRTLPATLALRDGAGRSRTLASLAEGHVAIVAFWSRYCGPAIRELPRLQQTADRAAPHGVRVMSIAEEQGSSPALEAFLKEKRVTLPTYFDPTHRVSSAFNQWGTPYYYVLDGQGRIRFAVTTDAETALAEAEALRLAERGMETP